MSQSPAIDTFARFLDVRAETLDDHEISPASIASRVHLSRLDDTFVDATCEPPEVFTYGGMIAHVLTFAAHRRTLVCGALYSFGITDLEAADPLRWVEQPAS